MPRFEIAPPPAGSFCPVCWGSGKPFGAGPTPSKVTAIFSGIQKGDLWVAGDGEPPNGSFGLEQSLSCSFTFINNDVDILFDLSGPGTILTADNPNGLSFDGAANDLCILAFIDTRSQTNTKFYGGQAEVVL